MSGYDERKRSKNGKTVHRFYVTPTDEDVRQEAAIRENGGNLTALNIAFTREYEYYGSCSPPFGDHWLPGSIFIGGEGNRSMFNSFSVYAPRMREDGQ